MLVELDFIETWDDTGFFLNGKSFKSKLEPKQIQGLRLFFDTDTSLIQIEYSNPQTKKTTVGFMDKTACYWVAKDPSELGYKAQPKKKETKVETPKGHPMVADISHAQVSNPTKDPQNNRANEPGLRR